MRALLILIAVLIGYGSLYPFRFAANPLWWQQTLALLRVPELAMGRGDLVGNLLLFVPWGLVAALRGATRQPVRGGALLLRLAPGLALALALQLAQLWIPGRVPALNDVLANGAGMLLGVLGARLPRRLGAKAGRAPQGKAAPAALPQQSMTVLLMLLWLGYQWFPWVPTLDRQNIVDALKPVLLAPRLDGVRALHAALAWCAFFLLWDLARAGLVPAWRMAVTALLVVAAKPFIVGASISPANLLGLGLALACLPWRRHDLARPVLVGAMCVGLLVFGLAPFDLQGRAQAFHWIPFTGLLEGSMSTNLLSLLDKSFFYGVLIVLLSARGGRPVAAAAALAACLCAIEAVQVFLPGRVAESTDPVLALLLGFVIRQATARETGLRSGAP
jgi:VanZ family protein